MLAAPPTIAERFEHILKHLKSSGKISSYSDLGPQLGYKSKSSISGIIRGAQHPTPDALRALHELFGISADYVLLGIGDMFVQKNSTGPIFTPTEAAPSAEKIVRLAEKPTHDIEPLGRQLPTRLQSHDFPEAFPDWKGLPMYNAPITASFVETFRDELTYRPQYYLRDPRFRDCDFGAVITGDSMHSEIRHGDFVVCKHISDRSFIVFGDIYYVVAQNGLETCKYINASPDPDVLILQPRNERLSPSPIHKDMINALYKVRGIVRGY
jgi:transcriptional regulator with XRE-family HTH domain